MIASLTAILARLRALQPGICPFVHTDDRGEELEMTVEYAAVGRIADDLEHAIRELRNARNERTECAAPERECTGDRNV